MYEMENSSPEITCGLDALLDDMTDHWETVLEGDFGFHVTGDGTARFDWFRDMYDDTEVTVPEVLKIPEMVGNHPVVEILPSFWQENKYIRQIIIPDSVSVIENNPFDNCPDLEQLVVSSDHPALAVENGLLIDRMKKSVICYPPALKTENVVIPDWVTSIGRNAFSNCSFIRSVSIPRGVTEIEEGAFSGCSLLKQVSLPSGLLKIQDFVFMDCTSLRHLLLPDGIGEIGNFSFSNCSSLVSVHLPDSIESFGCYVFHACEKLEEINLPLSLNHIDLPPFTDCNQLKRIIIPPEQETYLLKDCMVVHRGFGELVFPVPGALESHYCVPAGIKGIGPFAFTHMHLLQEIDFPEGVEYVAEGAFEFCKELRRVHFPESLTTLGDLVFVGCDNLSEINLPSNLHHFGQNCIFPEKNLCVTVAKGSDALDYCCQHQIHYDIR